MSSVKKTIKFNEVEDIIERSVAEGRKNHGDEYAEGFKKRLINHYLEEPPESGGYADVASHSTANADLARRVDAKIKCGVPEMELHRGNIRGDV